MTEYNETALVLEGGGNRGVFTAGVLDYLMEQKVEFPYVVGVSAGACNAIDYVSGQVGRTRRCMIVENKEYRYISLKNILDKKSLFDMDMIFDRYPNEIFPFDFDEYFKSDIECEMVVTNCLTGEAEYLSEKQDRQRLMDICRASIPLIHAMKKGHRKNVVILTRNQEYRKKKPGKSKAVYVAAFKKYPNLLNTLLNRYQVYNKTLELIEKWEKEGHIFVIRPEIETVSRTEQNAEALSGFYKHGYEVMKDRLGELYDYLEKEN